MGRMGRVGSMPPSQAEGAEEAFSLAQAEQINGHPARSDHSRQKHRPAHLHPPLHQPHPERRAIVEREVARGASRGRRDGPKNAAI